MPNHDGELHALCEVHSIQGPVEGSEVSDDMQSSWIDISGRLIAVDLQYHAETFLGITHLRYYLALEAHLPRIDQAKIWVDYDLHEGPGSLSPGEQVYCLQVARSNTLRFSLLLRTRGERSRRSWYARFARTRHGPKVQIYERIGVLEEAFGRDDGNERVDQLLRNLVAALPHILGPDLSNIENDGPAVLANRAGRPEERRAEVTVRETDRLPSTRCRIRIV